MKQWLAIFAAVAFLGLPAMVSAAEETPIPPEVNWSSTPPTPGVIAVPQKRVVSTAQEQASDSLRPSTARRSPAPLALTEEDAKYQTVNTTVHDD